MNRRHVFLWASYDFANSVYPAVITATVFGVYFANVVVGNETGQGDLWWGRAISVSMLLVALSSPLMGAIADGAGVRKKMLAFYTAICIVCVLLFTTIEPGMIGWAFLLVVLANIGFEGAMVFYNAYLPEIAPPHLQGRVSGVGFGLGYAGSAVGLLVAFPLVSQERFELTWVMVAGFFALFALPSLLWLPGDRKGSRTTLMAARDGILGFKRLTADVMRVPNLRRFLIAFFVYIDGVNTTVYFASGFAAKTLGFAQTELIILFIVVQMSALVGAFALARPTDTWGAKRVITLTLILWSLIAVTTYFVHSKTVFFAVAVLAGTGLGAVQAASRTLMASLIPAGKEAEMFGFYAFCGKSSSVVGPLVFGMISAGFGGNQRLAILSVLAFFLGGLLLLQRVRDPRAPGGASAVRVVAGIVVEDGRVLIAQRPHPQSFALCWEFPGGKVEPGESEAEALDREFQEELGIRVVLIREYGVIRYEDPSGRNLEVRFYLARRTEGEPVRREVADLKWITGDQADTIDFIPANRKIVTRLVDDLRRGEV